MKNLGWSEEKARQVEERFKTLYAESIEYIAEKIAKACSDGYVTCAFGLRLRTPLLKRTLLGNRRTPREAEAEARTAGNALGQSFCMLNNRAVSAFMEGTRSSEYRYSISVVAQIHDASYYLIKAEPEVLKYINDNLVREVYWQDLPEIQHPEVSLGGTLGVFYPSWEKEHEVKHYASLEEIIQLGEEIV